MEIILMKYDTTRHGNQPHLTYRLQLDVVEYYLI